MVNSVSATMFAAGCRGCPPVLEKRREVWIDRFQTCLSVRLGVYFVLYQAALWALFWTDARFAELGRAEGVPAFSAGFALTPAVAVALGVVFILDGIRQTHRILGPVYRFRGTIRAVTEGVAVSLVSTRAGDHLTELKDELNAMLRELEKRGAITLVTATDVETPQTVPA